MNFGMQTEHGNRYIFSVLQKIQNDGFKDRDALKILYDYLYSLSESSYYREAADYNVRQNAIAWLEEKNIIKKNLQYYVTI